MAVIAVGDLDVACIEKKIREHFSNLVPGRKSKRAKNI
jgi:predicted Zn-dependent peptidase